MSDQEPTKFEEKPSVPVQRAPVSPSGSPLSVMLADPTTGFDAGPVTPFRCEPRWLPDEVVDL